MLTQPSIANSFSNNYVGQICPNLILFLTFSSFSVFMMVLDECYGNPSMTLSDNNAVTDYRPF
jgi:hypothetical protein